MDSLLLQSLVSFLLIITSFILIIVELSLCADDPQYANCSQVINCGGWAADISYPFWGVNRPNYCGEPGLEVQCQGVIPVITSMNTNLTILKMNSGSPRTVKVATQGYWDNFCADNFTHTPLNFSLFNYPTSGLRNATFYESCNLYPSDVWDLPNNCSKASNMNNTSSSVNDYSFYTFSTSDDQMLHTYAACANEVVVPLSETAAVALDNGQGSIQDALDKGFELGLKINNDPCNNCEGSGGKCGYNMNESGFICFCRDQPHATTCDINSTTTTTTTSGSSSSSMLRDLVIGISAGVSGIIIITLCIICISRKRMVFFKKYEDNEFDVEAFIRNNGSLTPKRYSYSKVKKMTNSFKDKIGKGGYGVVYKGKLPDGLIVAVKVLIESKGNGEDFINEVASIGTTSHVNVITLLGFCYEKDKRALIYQYMPNGSLDNFIRNCGSSNANCRLEWETLSEIAVGIARGLHYLHRGCNTRILHFDIKPQNILLDNDFCPKISDFGLSKLCKTKESIVSMMGTRGTVGYIAPEVFSRNFGGVSHKSDVYSYGMLVLEMIGARKNLDSGVSHTSEMFPHYIYKDLELDKDENIFGTISEEEKERARKMILISLWCIQTNPSDRPSMRKVVEMLEGPLHSLPIPPKPLLFSPTRAVDESMTTTQPSETSQGN